MKGNKDAVAETIENNVRSKIIKEHLSDPAYYEKMSALLDEIIAARKARAIEYEEYLKRIAALAQRVQAGQADDTPEPLKNSPALRALYNNLKGPAGRWHRRAAWPNRRAVHRSPAIRCSIWRCRSIRPSSGRGPMAGAASRPRADDQGGPVRVL